MSLFFFLSGYVYKITQKWKSKGTRTRFIAYKFIKVAVPYFSISIFYILINSLTAKTNTSFSVTDIFSLWKTPVAQYWYIYALFMLLLLYAVLSKVCNDWIITVFLVLLAYIRTAMGINVPLFGICLGHAFSFGVGVCLPDIQYFNRKKIAPITDRGTCIDRIFDICFSDARCGTSQRLHANDWHYHKRITDWSSSRKQINTKVFAVYQ